MGLDLLLAKLSHLYRRSTPCKHQIVLCLSKLTSHSHRCSKCNRVIRRKIITVNIKSSICSTVTCNPLFSIQMRIPLLSLHPSQKEDTAIKVDIPHPRLCQAMIPFRNHQLLRHLAMNLITSKVLLLPKSRGNQRHNRFFTSKYSRARGRNCKAMVARMTLEN